MVEYDSSGILTISLVFLAKIFDSGVSRRPCHVFTLHSLRIFNKLAGAPHTHTSRRLHMIVFHLMFLHNFEHVQDETSPLWWNVFFAQSLFGRSHVHQMGFHTSSDLGTNQRVYASMGLGWLQTGAWLNGYTAPVNSVRVKLYIFFPNLCVISQQRKLSFKIFWDEHADSNFRSAVHFFWAICCDLLKNIAPQEASVCVYPVLSSR